MNISSKYVKMNTTSDQAQHLVALSMDKIKNAKGKKAGLNLHRSLLVSTVLFKAKTAIIMAKYNMRCDYQMAPESDDDDDVEYADDGDDQQVPDLDSDVESCDSLAESDGTELVSCDSDDKENSAPTTQWRENNVLSSSTPQGESKQAAADVVKCGKCVKRRLTEVECAVESITKRPCTQSDNVSTSQSDCALQQQQVPHERLDCQQVSNLVDSFHCSFSGLLEQQPQNSAPSTHHALSDAFSSCSTQIKDALAVTSSQLLLSV